MWFEIDKSKFSILGNEASNNKWYPYNKGGEYRKWYGNNEYVINWYNNGQELKSFPKSYLRNQKFYFKPGLTWTKVTSSKFSIRDFDSGFLFDDGGCCFFPNNIEMKRYFLGLLNSRIFLLLGEINPTLNFQPGDIAKTPIIEANQEKIDTISKVVNENVDISKRDWDSYETSWDFSNHFLIENKGNEAKIEASFKRWKVYVEGQFNKLQNNEEKLNSMFIDIYGLQDELSPKVDDNEITIRKADLERDIKSFISYAIGCSFGRYSLDEEGLVYAGGEFNDSRYKTFSVDRDNILPILPEAYFEDDIVSRFVDFVRVSYGENTLSENLDFVADVLGKKKGETAKETLRRYFLNDFYKDHVKTYSKRPIYWLFTSGKEKAFNCLIYIHRYDKTTLSRIRTDYLHDYQIRLDAEKKDLLDIIDGDSTAKEISNAKKELKSLEKKIDELKAYDELLHHMADMQIEIDLDHGVKVNYEKFKGLVAKI